MAEFYSSPGPLVQSITWSSPSPDTFIKLARTRLEWEVEYSLEKFIQVAARWQVKNPGPVLAEPATVLKKRIKGGEDMVEVEWRSVAPALPATFITCVPLRDFHAAHPTLLELYEEGRLAARKKIHQISQKEGGQQGECDCGQNCRRRRQTHKDQKEKRRGDQTDGERL